MTVTVQEAASGPYFPNGVATQFPFDFKAAAGDEIAVVLVADDGTFAPFPAGSFSVALAVDNEGGTVTMAAAPVNDGRALFVVSAPSFAQEILFEDEGPFNSAVLNPLADRSAIRDIWLRDQANRSIRVPFGESGFTLPSLGKRLSGFWSFDVDGQFRISSGTGADKGLRDDLASPDVGGAIVAFLQRGIGAVVRSIFSKMQESVSITDFGASAYLPDNSPAIQRAIDSGAGAIYIPDGVFLVRSQAHSGLPGTFGGNSVCIKPRSNLHIYGPGTLKLADGAGGPSGAVIGNWDGLAIENVTIECRIDGNRANAGGSMSGVVIVYGTNCTVQNGIVQNCSFNGVQFAKGSVSCTAQGMRVDNIGYIGIQYQQADAAKVLFNKLVSCVDNAIDLEANNGTQTRNVILGNTTKGCATGVFLESGGDTIVIGNITEDTNEAGVWLNRINNGAENCIIANNTFRKGTGIGNRGGIYINNVCGKSIIHDNKFDGFAKAIICEGATNYLQIHDCYFKNISQLLISASRQVSALLKSHAYNLHYEGPLSGPAGQERFPYTYSPTTNPANFPDRDFNVTVESAWNLDTGGRRAAAAEDEYRSGKAGQLDANAAWSNAFSIFFGGETLVYEAGVAMTVGNYILLNGATFLVFGTGGAGEFKLRSAAGAAGDFTATTNGSHAWVEHWPEWQSF